MLVEITFRNATKQGASADFIVHINASGAATDRIDARQVLGGALEGITNSFKVIIRVTLKVGIPSDFFGKNDFAVNDCGGLAIAAAEIKPDAAAVQMPTERLPGSACLRHLVFRAVVDGQIGKIDSSAQNTLIKRTRPLEAVGLLKCFGEIWRATHQHPTAAPLPEQELQQSLCILEV